jgi:hypothetical protein
MVLPLHSGMARPGFEIKPAPPVATPQVPPAAFELGQKKLPVSRLIMLSTHDSLHAILRRPALIRAALTLR